MSSPWRVLTTGRCLAHSAAVTKADTDLEENIMVTGKINIKDSGKALKSDDLSSQHVLDIRRKVSFG